MLRTWLKSTIADWLIALGLFGLALWLRGNDLAHFVTADEHNWVYRSGIFLHALLQQDWPATSVWYTPAVITTWLGSGSLALFYQLHQAAIDRPLAEWAVSFSRNKIELEVLLALRWSMALVTSLMVVVVYGLARKLWSRPVALLGTLLLLTEPHLLAVSRIIGHDALITFFAIASLLAFFYGRRKLLFIDRRPPTTGHRKNNENSQKVNNGPELNWITQHATRNTLHIPYSVKHSQWVVNNLWFALSGLFAGLAILSKAPAMILIPFVGLVGLADIWQHKTRSTRWLGAGLAWGGALGFTFIAAWPAAWVNPLGQAWFVISTAFLSSAGLEDADLQPHWSIPNLGYFYYLVHGAFKVSPFLLVGAILAGVRGWPRLRQRRLLRNLAGSELAWLFLFAVLFTLMMSLGVKKSPRYILPAFPALAFIAAWGWLYILQRFNPPVAITILGGLAVLLTLNYAPYYFTYYNPLLGGSLTAPHLVRIGWGEGLDEVGRRLSARPTAPAEHLGARYTATLFPFYEGQISSPDSEELDYVTFYIKQSQSGYPAPEILNYFAAQEPLHRVVLNGIEYAQVYSGPGMQLVPNGGNSNLPVAFRPHTIYAPIGGQLLVDLLWPANSGPAAGQSVTLAIQSGDASFAVQSRAAIAEQAPGVRVSQHTFNLPDTLERGTYTLFVGDASIGEIKARVMEIPPNFEPLSVVMAGQLKLAGVRHRVEGNQLLVDLAWQGWPGAHNDYTAFVQLVDSNEQRVAGVDVLPQRGFTTLDRKEVMLTHYAIPLPDNLPPGRYNLLVGLYYFAGEELINVGAGLLEPPVVLE